MHSNYWGDENSEPVTVNQIAPISETFRVDDNSPEPSEGRLAAEGKGKRTQVESSSTRPLEEVSVNTVHRRERVPGALRSYVRHTGEWIPRNFAREPRQVTNKNPIPSQTGACGKIFRLIPPQKGEQAEEEDEPCPWRVRCQRQKGSGKFAITQCELRHNCGGKRHKWQAPAHNSKWLAQTLALRVVRNINIPIKELQSGFRQDYKK